MRSRMEKSEISVPSIIRTVVIFLVICRVLFCVSAYTFGSDLSYNYKIENQEEFVIVRRSNISI